MALVVAGVSVVQGYVLARSAAAVSCPADVTEDTLATIAVPANALGPNGMLRFTLYWSMTNNGNNKTGRTRYSGAAGTIMSNWVVPNQNLFREVTCIFNRGATNSQVSSRANAADNSVYGVLGGGAVYQTGAVDTTLVSSAVITGQKTSAGDALTLESYLVELFPTV